MNFIRNIFSKIKTSYFKSLRGEENFWIVLFGWGLGTYIFTALITIIIFALRSIPNFEIVTKLFNDSLIIFLCEFLMSIFGPFGLVFLFIYPIMLIFTLIISIKKSNFYFIFAIIGLILFSYLHYRIFTFVLAGTVGLFLLSPLGWLTGLFFAIYLTVKTYQTLSTKK